MTPIAPTPPFSQRQWDGFPADKFISTVDAAYMLGVHEDTLRRWGDREDLAFTRLPGGHRRYRVGELKDFMRRTKQKGQK